MVINQLITRGVLPVNRVPRKYGDLLTMEPIETQFCGAYTIFRHSQMVGLQAGKCENCKPKFWVNVWSYQVINGNLFYTLLYTETVQCITVLGTI